MIEKDLDKVLNYMKQYVENKYEHDSEPMLTWKDLKLILNEIERLKNKIEVYKNANEYHQNIIYELETIKQPNQLYSENVKLRAENKRLNNIINEAINYIDDNTYYKNHKGHINIDDVYIILQKGSESNE